MKETMSRLDMITYYNTPKRIARIDRFDAKLIRSTEIDFGLEFSERIVSPLDTASSLQDLLEACVDTFTKAVGEKKGAGLAYKMVAPLLAKKIRELLLHCEVFFEDEVGEADCVLEDREFLSLGNKMLTKIHYDYD